MKKSSVAVAILLLAGTLLVGIAILPQNARAATLYVGGGGPGNYTTIQAAIDAAFPGDIVYVYNGTYNETVSIAKTLSLVGEDISTTIIDTLGGGDAIHISSSWVNVTGFTLMSSGIRNGAGIELNMVRDCYIANNSMGPNFIDGILLFFTSGNRIVNNTVSGNGYGIDFYMSTKERILNNTIVNHEYGIYHMGSSYSTIKGNTMVGNSIYLLSLELSKLNTHTIDTSNTVNGKPVYYWKNLSGGNVPLGAGEVIIVNCTDVTVQNQNVSGGTVGIYVTLSANITLSNITASYGVHGIEMFLTQNSTLSLSNASHNTYDGIGLQHSPGNTLRNNTAFNNALGFMTGMSGSGTFTGNTASRNREGFWVYNSDDSTLAHNNATMNTESGIVLWSADRSNVTNCSASANGFAGISLSGSVGNTIKDNNISGNQNYGINLLNSGKNTLSNNEVLSSWKDGIHLETSNDNTIARNNISDSVTGINVTLSNGNVLRSNSALGNSIGIYINRSSYGTIQSNTASDNIWGIFAQHSGTNMITNNTLNNIVYGVFGKDLNDVVIRENAALNNTIAMALRDSRNVTVRGNNVSGLMYGIGLIRVNESKIANNTSLHNSREGIKVGVSSNVTIEGNRIWNSWAGILLDYSTGITVANNTLVRTGILVWGRTVEQWNSHTIETSNAVNGKPVYYWKDTVGGAIPFGAGQVILANCSGVEVRNQDVSNTSAGIQVGFSSRNLIVSNTARGAHVDSISFEFSDNNTVNENVLSSDRLGGDGLHLDYSNDNLVTNNTAMTNWFGMLVDCSEGNDIRNNDVSDSEHGIHLSDSNYNTISGNEVHNNDDGIHLHYAFSNTVEGNAAHDNVIGIYVRQSDDNVVRRNNVSLNAVGIRAGWAYGNRIYHNRLYDNTAQAFDNTNANQWDDGYPSGGNYWSDYAGVDLMWGPGQNLTGSDGIGDTPYVIDADSQDRYPLMMPLVPPARPPVAYDTRLSGNGFENVTVQWLLSPDDGEGYYSVVEYKIYRGTAYDSDGLGYELIATLANGTSTFTDTFAGEGDPNSYFYAVCAIDRDNFTACAADQAGKFTRPLALGPNSVSVPLMQSDMSIEIFLQTVAFDQAWAYDSGGTDRWQWYMPFKPYRGDLRSANHTKGVWVNVTEECNLTVAGIVPAQTMKHLHKGWNLVGFPSFNSTYTVADLRAETGATRVEGFDPSAPPHFLKVLTDGETLQAGYGYWIHVESDITWVVQVS